MIIELLVGLVAGLLSFIGGLFGSWSMPEWWGEVDDSFAYLGEAAGGFSQWFPFSALTQGLTFVGAAIGVALGIKLVRIVASFLTAGGGSAA